MRSEHYGTRRAHETSGPTGIVKDMKPGAKSGLLRIEIQHTAHAEMWTLYGALTGDMVDELAATWKNSRNERNGHECMIDLIEVTSVDERGEQVLLGMMQEGARFIVRGVYSKSLLDRLSQRRKQEK
jgi:ABC-type transporter Mla MlaB component